MTQTPPVRTMCRVHQNQVDTALTPSETIIALDDRIPFNVPTFIGDELQYVSRAIGGQHTSSGGPFSDQVSELLSQETGAAQVLLTTSCTSALEMAAMLVGAGPGTSVIVPSFTFVSTALAFARQGARLLFADIEPNTLGLDPTHVASLMDETVRAIVPVHYAGIAGEIDALQDLASGWDDVSIVEDNAHGLFGAYRGRALGSLGRLSALSFHETKNFVCGEGGALVINDPEDVDRAGVLFEKGTNRRAFKLGRVDKYSWTDIGSSFGLSDVLAAYLAAQLAAREQVLAKRKHAFELYDELLSPLAEELGFQTPQVPDDRTQSYHMFYVLLPDMGSRDRMLKALDADGVQGTFHYVPLHSSAGAQAHLARETECPVTEDISGRLLRLPFYTSISDQQIHRVAEAFLRHLA